ncbi:uncharacterized protein LOC121430527 [Lytechinus variegatus]|uniref:uncharacterized protein LOC121430527 n=1 Tax=Lytechinus variegatus TaxID=7654 RepID=UPI001BB1766C|nr:uncharacterized protein LOC121430527 [Lytechinus variegatus]
MLSSTSMFLRSLQSMLTIALVCGIFWSPLQTACTTVPSSTENNPCELRRKCHNNPILYHNYQKCIICTGRELAVFPKGLDPERIASAAELRENNLSVIQESDLANFSRLYYLDLSVNVITTLHDGWADNLSRLQYLYLSNNELRSIRNGTFTGLFRLQYLHLDGNSITALPSQAFGQLPQLQVVHLQRNSLQMLSGDAFLGLKQLRKLNLGNNRLRMLLPDSLTGLQVLNELILSENLFSEVPVLGLASLVGLQHLRLDGNMIEELPRSAFVNLRGLIELTVASNNIIMLHGGWCEGLGMLQYINISNNKVETLSADTFQSCPNIVIIDFSYNHLNGVPESIFRPLQNHHAVDLHFNKLTFLPQLEIANDSLVTDIRLGGNPLYCDCLISWLKDWMGLGRISEIRFSPDDLFLKGHYAELNKASAFLDAACTKPDNLSGKRISNISAESFTCSSTPQALDLSSVLPDLTGSLEYSIRSTIKTSTMSDDAVQVKFDVKMGIIVFLAVLSFVLMVILVLVVFPRPVCRWREQVYFYISEPPLPARYQNVGYKVADSSTGMDDSTSLVLIDVKIKDSKNTEFQNDLDQVSTPNPQKSFGESELSGPLENKDSDCHFYNGRNTISSAGGKQWSVRVHSSHQDLSRPLCHDALQSSCNLHGQFGICKPVTELRRYHQALEREATASLARGVILEHMRQCCTSHKSSNTIPRRGKESFTGTAQTKPHGHLLCNQPLGVHCSSIEDIGVMSRKEQYLHQGCDDSSRKFPVQKDKASTRSLSSRVIPKSFTNNEATSLVADNHDGIFSSGKSQRLSCPVDDWPSTTCLQDTQTDTGMVGTSLTTSCRRSRSVREPKRPRNQTSYRAPYRQMSWHGNRPFAYQRNHCEVDRDYTDNQTSRHMPRPPAPLPRPQATLRNADDTVEEQLAHQFTNKKSKEKGAISTESDGLKVQFKEYENGEEGLYFEPIE